MKTVSLELAKQLKEAGFPQETDFFYTRYGGDKWGVNLNLGIAKEFGIAAPTADDLLDSLPANTDITLSIKKGSKQYHVNYWWGTPNPLRKGSVTDYWQTHGDNPADALAEMWIYLKKHNLMLHKQQFTK